MIEKEFGYFFAQLAFPSFLGLRCWLGSLACLSWFDRFTEKGLFRDCQINAALFIRVTLLLARNHLLAELQLLRKLVIFAQQHLHAALINHTDILKVR